MIDQDTAFFEKTVSGNIDVSILYDGTIMVDGAEVTNIFDIAKKLNDKLLDAVDTLYRNQK